jgi:aminoglycoside phosphotransferase (APT) family kinase protein
LYRIEVGGAWFACKLCVPDERRRAAREYHVMRLLQMSEIDVAPAPFALDESCSIVPFPAVIYRWLSGPPLAAPLSAQQLAALLDSLQRTHSLRTDAASTEPGTAWFHWFDWGPYLADLNALLKDYGGWLADADPRGPALRERLARLVDRCAENVAASNVSPARENIPVCLCRVDPNLANVVCGADGRLRWVDWEYSGWGDPALDLSELRWHATLIRVTEAQQRWLRDHYRRPRKDASFDQRLTVWDHILATRWPLLILRWLWTMDNGPDRLRLSQVAVDPAQLRERLGRFIERAEQLVTESGIAQAR